MTTAPVRTLAFHQLRKGMRVRITAVDGDCPEIRRLMDMGLTLGVAFEVVRVAPLGDPVEIDLRGYRLCLRRSEAGCFELERLD